MALPPLDASQFGPMTRLRTALIFRWVAANNRRAEKALRAMPALWDDIRYYVEKSSATGASMSDYLTLYREVRRLKPREVLELGTGVSTVVLVRALMDNAGEGAPMRYLRQADTGVGNTGNREYDANRWPAPPCRTMSPNTPN